MHTRIMYPIAAASVAALGQAAPASATASATAARPADRPVTAYVLQTPPCMSNTVSVINTATNTALKPITVGIGTSAIAVTPNGKTVYVSSGASIVNGMVCGSGGPQTAASTVTPISTATNKPGKPINAGKSPGPIAITPDGRTAYVLSQRGVVPISTATNKPGKPINAGKDLTGIAITPDGKTAYVVSTSSATVTPIRTATNTALKLIKVGNGQPAQPGPSPIAITPNGKTAYVVNLIAGTVTPISTAANAPGRPVAVKSSPGVMLDGIGIAPDGRTAFILNEVFEPASFPGTVIPFRTATNTQGKPITVGSAPSAIVFAR